MEKKIFELVMNKVRYEHLKENLGNNVNFISYFKMQNGELDLNFVKFSVELTGIMDVLDLYHTGIKFGLGIAHGDIRE